MVSFELFVRPAIRLIGGHRSLDRIAVPAVAEADLRRSPDGKTHFVRARISLDAQGAWRVRPMVGQDSHQLRAMADANSLAVLPDGEGVGAGGQVEVLLTEPEGLIADPVGSGTRRW
jgi:molybdopterin biosynthesis enzyme